VKNEIEDPTRPSLADIISDIPSGGGSETRRAKTRDPKEEAKVPNFPTNNNVSSPP
jgi:hypothetical protein